MTFYTPNRDDILKLSPDQAEQLIQQILWTYVDRMGCRQSTVDIIESIPVSRRPRKNVQDGGLELSIKLPEASALQDPFKHRSTIVQVKSGKMQLNATKINEEISKEKVKKFLEKGGHYVIAYTGIVPTYGEHDTTWKNHLDELHKAIQNHYPNNNVTAEIWTPDDIERFTINTPQSWYIFASGDIFATFASKTLKNLIETHALDDYGFDTPFVKSEAREEQLKTLQEWLEKTNGGYFELRGNMGVGKSRLIYEAVVTSGREATTIWQTFSPDPSFISICEAYLNLHKTASLRMVIDECDDQMADRLRNLTQLYKERITLLTIIPFKSRDATINQTKNICILNKMSKDELKLLLQSFSLQDEIIDWIIHICDGYPKLARVLAEESKKATVQMSKTQLITWLTENEIFQDPTVSTRGWANLILDKDDKEVLRVLALLTEVGREGARKDEYKMLCDFFELNHDTIETVINKNLKKGLLAKGSDYIYVTPLILASYLCVDRLSTMRQEKFEGLCNLLKQFSRPHYTGTAVESLCERIRMSTFDDKTQFFLLEILESFRPFDIAILQSEVVAELAFSCAYSQPHKFIKSFVQDIKKHSSSEIKQWENGRRRTVNFFESAAFYPELFNDAIEGLFYLSKAENETWDNNATNTWSRFFSPTLSGSMTPLVKRFDWLIQLIESKDDSIELIEKAIAATINPNRIRMIGHENQLGLAKIEINNTFNFLEYHNSLSLLIEAIKRNNFHIKRISKIFIDNLSTLVLQHTSFFEKNPDVMFWLKKQSEDDLILQQHLLIACHYILEWGSNKLEENIKKLFEDLHNELEQGSLESKVRRWTFDSLHRDFETENNNTSSFNALIDQIISNPSDLIKLEPILTHPGATRSLNFSFKLGEKDQSKNCWHSFNKWNNQKNAAELKLRYLVGRFYAGEAQDWVDDQVDKMNDDTDNFEAIVIASKDIETQRSLDRLLIIAKSQPKYIHLLVYGGRASRLNDLQLAQTIDLFIDHHDFSNLSPLWDVLGQYADAHKNAPFPLNKSQIQFLFNNLYSPITGTMTDYYQDRTLSILIKYHTNEIIAQTLAKDCLYHLLNEKPDYRRSKRSGEILKKIANKFKNQIFETILNDIHEYQGIALLQLRQLLLNWSYEIFVENLTEASNNCDEKVGASILLFIPDGYEALNEISATLIKRFPNNVQITSTIARAFFSGVFDGTILSTLVRQIEFLDSWSKQYEIEKLAYIRELKNSLSDQLAQARKLDEEEAFLRRKDR